MAEERSINDRVADVLGLPQESEDGEWVQEEAEEAPVEAQAEEVLEDDDGDTDDEPDLEASDEADSDDDESDEEPESELVEVEYDGVLYEVPPDLKDALMRTADYTQKTQAVAQERKAIEVAIESVKRRQKDFEFAESIWEDALKVHSINDQIKQYDEYLRQNLDNLGSSDIEKIRFHKDELRNQQQNLANELQSKQQQHQQAQEQALQELLNKGTEVLRQRIPGWGEETVKQVKQYALNSGYTEQEVAQLVDPRIVETMYKASMYDSLKQGAKPVKQKLAKAPTIKEARKNPMPDSVKQKLNTRKKLKSKNLSDRDKSRVIQDEMERRIFGS
jgi:hypothetical protein